MPKSISGAVGKGGKNRSVDVLTVQYLLNCVPKSNGGPAKELILDGLCGLLTEAAIVQFQRSALGFADGRVDEGGQTIATLLCYDPYPSMKLTLPTVDSSGKGNGKQGGNPMNNCWDPFGYYNPSHENYMKGGYEPPPFEGKQQQEIDSSTGHKWGGSGEQAAKGGGYGGQAAKGGGYGGQAAKGGGYSGQAAKGGGFGGKTGQGAGYGGQAAKGGGFGGKTGQGGGNGGQAAKGGGFGGKAGQETPGGQGGGPFPYPPGPNNSIIDIPGKTGSTPQSNVKGSQNQGGIVGKV